MAFCFFSSSCCHAYMWCLINSFPSTHLSLPAPPPSSLSLFVLPFTGNWFELSSQYSSWPAHQCHQIQEHIYVSMCVCVCKFCHFVLRNNECCFEWNVISCSFHFYRCRIVFIFYWNQRTLPYVQPFVLYLQSILPRCSWADFASGRQKDTRGVVCGCPEGDG